jgi:hypothetical protein
MDQGVHFVLEQEPQRHDVLDTAVHESERSPLHTRGREGAGIAEQIESAQGGGIQTGR